MTPDEQYAANLAIITTARPEMAAQLAQFPLTNVQLMPGQDGHLFGTAWDVTNQQWVPLCHPADPIAEAEAACDAVYSPLAKVYTLLGMGLGYIATALARRLKPYQRLVIWDLDPNMYKAAMYAVDLAPMMTGARVDIFVGDDIVQQVEHWWLSLDVHEKLYIASPLRAGYTAHFRRAPYDILMERTIDMLRFHAVGLSTWRMFGYCIGDNDLLNLPEYVTTPGYEHLRDLWQGQPAVCLAAGPSLRQNVTQLCAPAVRDRIAIITAGTIYALCRQLRLEPDVVTTIDFQRLNWTDQFQHVPLDADCPLVYLHSTYPQTVRRWPGPRFVAENASDTVSWFRPFTEGKLSAAQVQTVAHLSLMVALEMGANPILLLGQDLSMPRDQHHAPGARAQDQAPNEVPPEAFLTVPDYAGTPVDTRHSFLSMKTVFERLAAAHPGRTILNCSEAGLALPGIPNMPLAEALALPQCVPLGGQHQSWTLRNRIRQRFTEYKPQVQATLGESLRRLRAEAEALMGVGRRVPAFLREHGLYTEATRQWVLAQEGIIQAHPAAWGLFAVRNFTILEVVSAPPPDESTVPDAAAKERYNCARLVRVAEAIAAEAPAVRRILHETLVRLEDVLTAGCPVAPRALRRQLVRQEYHLVWRLLHSNAVEWQMSAAWDSAAAEASEPISTARRYAELCSRVLVHTQQYEAALALMRAWDFAPARIARVQRHLRTFESQGRDILPVYYTPPPTPTPTEPQVGLQIGA